MPNLVALVETVRNELDDATAPYLWSDEELLDYFADAENEACRRARLLIDSSTVAICQIPIVVDTSEYDLDGRILFIRRARLTSTKLRRASYRDLDSYRENWEIDEQYPSHFITDLNTSKVTIYPIPKATDTLYMTVVRLPLNELISMDNTPEIKAHYHRSLRFWVIYRAYMKKDAETYQPDKAQDNYALFEQEFGKKSSAVEEEWIERELAHDAYSGVF